jgi:hypothetical protein
MTITDNDHHSINEKSLALYFKSLYTFICGAERFGEHLE